MSTKKYLALCVLAFVLAAMALPKATLADILIDRTPLPDPPTNPQDLSPDDWATEEAWVESLLADLGDDTDLTYLGKDEDNSWNDGVWDEGVPTSDWTHAVLKYGQGDAVSQLQYAVYNDDGGANVDFAALGLSQDSLSHITYFGPAPVPEPATMLLLGTGLVGLVGLRKKLIRK